MKKGFTLLELMVSIAVIGILISIGFKGYSVIIENSKTKKVIDEIKQLETSISGAQAVRGIIWGGEGTTVDSLNPLKSPTAASCNFSKTLNSGTTECNENTIMTEKILFDSLTESGFIYSNNTFRLPSHPSTEVGFTASLRGYQGIYIKGLPGNIASKVYKN